MNSLERVDGIASISAQDTSRYRELGIEKPIRSIPFGIEIDHPGPNGSALSLATRLFHLGSMDWLPNREGVEWLLKEVWPRVLETQPEATLYLAGRHMPTDLLEREEPQVHIMGEVSDATEFIEKNGIMLVPILSAGGIRVKIIEGMAQGKPIVSTPIGAAGIDYKHGENILIGETAEDFAEHIHTLISRSDLRRDIGKNARELVEKKYEDRRIIGDLLDFYKELEAKT